MSSEPTPAQRRALLEAIESGRPVRIKAGASASRMRANLLRAGWLEGGRPTAAAYAALGLPEPAAEHQARLAADDFHDAVCTGPGAPAGFTCSHPSHSRLAAEPKETP